VLEIAPLDEPNHQVLMLAALESGDEQRADREMALHDGAVHRRGAEGRSGDPGPPQVAG